MNPFESMQALADLWGKGAEALASTYPPEARAVADEMSKAFGGGSMPDTAALEEARRSFEQAWSAANQLSASLSDGLQRGDGSGQSDPIVSAMLARIFDPRGWMTATNEVDEALQRMAEGPRLADLWNVERQFAEVFRAWISLRQRSFEHNKVMLDAWTRAAGAFAKRLNERSERGEPPLDSVRAFLTLWGETANEILLETQRSDAFLETQREVLKASTDLRLAQRKVAEFYSEMFGYPTRAELDDVHKAVTELRRELRALKRSMPRTARPSQVQEKPSEPKAPRRVASAKTATAASKRKGVRS
jgi:class III poly(R)-hydroxyalkanoic acid synthase PhaE subunit